MIGGLALGCGSSPTLPPGFTEVEAAAFQRTHEASITDELGPLAAVASHYVEPGQTLVLGVVDGAVVTEPPPAGPRLRLTVADDGARCLEGCGPAPRVIEDAEPVRLDRFTVLLSPQSGSLRALVHDPQSPARAAHQGLRWYPVDARFIVPARFEPDPERPTVELATSRGLAKAFVRAGVLRGELLGTPIALHGYLPVGADDEAAMLVPFSDETSGVTTYPVGRYVQVSRPEPGSDVTALDLNRATNPWCAYSEHYNCPVPPADDHLRLAVEAGEQTYGEH